MRVFDNTECFLGEGPLWHPELKQLFWFDIINAKLYSLAGDTASSWCFDQMVSAAGWVSKDELLIASETSLFRFNILTGEETLVVPLEADNTVTRSNDGRADPWGGFWIGTMGKNAEPGAGAIYRYYDGELRKLYPDITISNAICFAPDRSCAYYTDTPTKLVMRQPLQAEDGWPDGESEIFLDLNEAGLNPDGAVIDANGNIWVACWGDGGVHVFSPEGKEIERIGVRALHVTCPAFGGLDYSTLYVTTAQQDLPEKSIELQAAGQTFFEGVRYRGLPEPAVKLAEETGD